MKGGCSELSETLGSVFVMDEKCERLRFGRLRRTVILFKQI
jgi:hypothetical protein